MILLSVSGTRWNGAQIAFAPHAISIKTSIANCIWNDRDPDNICLINPENKTFFVQPLQEYAHDIGRRLRDARTFRVETKSYNLPDGTAAKELTVISQSRGHGERAIQKMIAIPNVVLPEKSARAWSLIMNSDTEKGFMVSLSRVHGRYDETSGPSGGWRNLVVYRSMAVMPTQTERFTVPKSFTRAQDETALYFSTQGGKLKKSDLDDLFFTPAK